MPSRTNSKCRVKLSQAEEFSTISECLTFAIQKSISKHQIRTYRLLHTRIWIRTHHHPPKKNTKKKTSPVKQGIEPTRLNIQNGTAHHVKIHTRIKSFSNSPTGQPKNNKDWSLIAIGKRKPRLKFTKMCNKSVTFDWLDENRKGSQLAKGLLSLLSQIWITS